MNTKMKFSKQILSIVLCLAMVLQFMPMTAHAAADTSPYAPTIAPDGVSEDNNNIFANGTPITIEAAGSGTAVWYMDEGTKKYVNPNGANGDDLSGYNVYAGSNNADGMNCNGSITMTGGTIKTIYAGQSRGTFRGTSTITVTGGTISDAIYCNARYVTSQNDFITTVTIFDSTGATIIPGSGKADNVVRKKDSNWTVSGNGIIPEGITVSVSNGETLTVPSGATLTNNGTLVNNGGTIKIYGKLFGNAPENYVAPIDFTFNTETLKANISTTLSEAVCTTSNTTLFPWFTYEIADKGTTEATLSGRTLTPYNQGTVKIKVTMQDGYCEPISKTFDFPVDFTQVTGISGDVPTEAWVNLNVTLPTMTITPENASYSTLVWSVVNANGTGVTIDGSTLKATNAGIATIRATVENGTAYGTAFTKDYMVTFKESETIDISLGSVTISKKNDTTLIVTYSGFSGGSKEYSISKPINISGTTTSNCITVESNVNAKIVFSNLTIERTSGIPVELESGSNITLTLHGENIIKNKSGLTGDGAVVVQKNATLCINGEGGLIAESDGRGAAIGGKAGESAGTIIILGGIITANNTSSASSGGAAIGGGGTAAHGSTAGNCGMVIIRGGTITASGNYGAGIGNGAKSNDWDNITPASGGDVYIYGGTINASSKKGSPIGKASNGSFGTLTNGSENGNQTLSQVTITLNDIGDGVSVSDIDIPDYYSTNGVVTMDGGKIYLWLPADTMPTCITLADGTKYICKDSSNTYYTSHEWNEGTCSRCGETCDHNGATSGTCGICGKTLHTHSWKYTVSGATITASCDADGCDNTNGGSVTIVAPDDPIYDGTAKEATYTGTLVTGDEINIVYDSTTDELVSGKPVYAGNYTARITLGGKTATVEFTIEKATPTADDFVYSAPNDLTFNGAEKTATVSVKDGIIGMGEVNIVYYIYNGAWYSNDRLPLYPSLYRVDIWVKEGDNYKGVDSAKRIELGQFTIQYLTTDAKATVSGEEGANGWYIGEVTLTAPDGYEISETHHISDFGSSSLTFSAEQNGTVTYYLKDANGYVAKKTVELKIDLTDPTAEYQIGTDGWKKFINTISFGLFCKDYKTVEIKYNDENSGVATKQYYIANAELSEDELKNVSWNDYTEMLNLTATGKYFIYIRVVDNAGREVVLNSEGIVVYGDSEAVTESVSTTYHAESDKDVEVKFNGNTVKEIKNGNTVLDSTDFTVDTANGKITLKADYLDTLNAGTYTFTVSYNPQGVETDKVTLATTTFKVVVEKADISNITTPTAANGLTYNGNAQSLINAGSAQGGELQYSLDGVTYSKNVPTAKNAGEYTVYYKVVGDKNHKDVAAKTLTVKIETKPITVTIENKTSVYGDAIVTLTATDNGIVSGDTNVYKLTTTATSSASVGKYDIVGEAISGNYDITFKNENDAYEITRRELTLTVVVDDKPYDGTNTANINSVVINNVVGTDAVQVVYGTATFNSVDAANGIGIAFTEFTLGGEDAGNYTLKQPTGVTANITNNWTPAEYTVNGDGWMNYDFVITANDGYRVSLTDTANGEWSDTLTVAVEGESSITFYLKNEATGEISLAKTVSYKLDKNTETTGTAGKVFFDERNGWEAFLNTITFGLFYKDEVTVKVEATDKLSGVESIEYVAFNEAKTLDDVKAIADSEWKAMPTDGVAVTVEDAKQFVYFVRITDNAGNVTYISTDGAEYDTTAPAISGVESGKTYYTTQKVTVTEKNVASITLNGEAASENITLEGNKDATYTIVVTDKAGNSTTVTVAMKPIADVDTTIDGITEDNVTSDDKETVQDVIDEIDELLKDEDLSDDEKAALEEIKEKADNLNETIEDAAKATETENTEKVKDVTAENVTPEDKTDLEKAKDDLEKALEDYGDNYTDDEKKAIDDEIKRIDDALEIIENVENVEELIDKLPENITKDDEAAIKAADDAYNALTDYEKSLVDDAAKKALDDAKAALAELNKIADSTSPSTGDNSNLWLWFALLFVSGAGIFGITVFDRKRKAASRR